MKKFNLFKMLAVLIVLITSINTTWADVRGWHDSSMWQVWGYKNPGFASDGWLIENIDNGHEYNLGVILSTSPSYTFKGLGVKTWGGGNVDGVKCYFVYPDNTESNISLGKSGNPWGDGSTNQYWEHKSIWNYTINKSASPGDYEIKIYFTIIDESKEYNQNLRKIQWTIPGFSVDPADKSFGTTVPVGRETETTVSFSHHGTAITTGNCSITNDSEGNFSVRSASNSGVNVVFNPRSTGAKSATLTITDAYSNTKTVTLSGTAVAQGATTRFYFNNYLFHSNWVTDGALSRFTCEYTTGVYTHYPMTQCENSTYNYYADVELKSVTPTVDRYNPSAPYNTWNTLSISSLNSSNPYAILDNFDGTTFFGYATNHSYNEVSSTGVFYYDNSKSGFGNTIYWIVGFDYDMDGSGAASTHSVAYSLSYITNTKLYYGSASDSWTDATYYAVVGASSDPSGDNNWGSSSVSSKGTNNQYTAAYKDIFDIAAGEKYLAFAPQKTNGTMTIAHTNAETNTSQTFNYALSVDGGDTYTTMTSGSPNTPGQLSLASYKFDAKTPHAVAANDAQTLSADATTYTKTYEYVAYTGTTVLTESSTRSGYTFMGWYAGDAPKTDGNTHSYTYCPREDSTFTARYKAHRYTIIFDANDAQYARTTSYGSMESMSNVVYDQSTTLPANGFHRIGYKFDGWATTPSGSVDYADKATAILNLTTTDGGSARLYAKWSTDANTFTGPGTAWDDDENWSGNAPTNDDATITINQPVTISGGSYHIGELSFGEGGSLTIAADGALEVAGTITNTDANKIVINSSTTNQGALIFNSTGSTAATVNMTMNAASDMFQFIAIPVSYVSVSEKFPGSTVYTYGWSNTKHDWERRGYYDGFSSFEAVLVKGQGSASFSGNLVATGERGYSGTYSADNYGYVYMYGNSWTAPITMSEEGFDNASIGIMNGSANSWDGVIAGQVIPALQAFAVAVNSGGGSITINYDRDVRNPSNPNAPLKAPQRLTSEVQEPITVYVSGNEMQTRIRLFEDATRFTDEFDNGWEALYMEGYGYAGEMYAIGTDKMNVLATNNLEGTVVGFVPGQAENYTISFEGDGKGYYLNDIKMEEATLIDEGNTYEFTSDEKTNATRFVISKTPIKKTPTSVENIGDGVKARKQMINGALYIIRDGRIYNAEGSLVK